MTNSLWQPVPIRVECLKKTLPPVAYKQQLERVGLVTVRMTIPLYVWVELLTHRRLSRNAASARAMSFRRVLSLGYYKPPVLYQSSKGMAVGERLPDADHQFAQEDYERVADLIAYYVDGLDQTYHIAKEQLNRLLPTNRMIAGIVTGTKAAWDAFFALRSHPTADVAMQEVARATSDAINTTEWTVATEHLPYDGGDRDIIAARIARVSYHRDEESEKKNRELAQRLKDHRHLSPFEHIATWRENPAMSNFTSCVDDVLIKTERSTQFWKNDYYGWHQYRKDIE